MIQKMHFDSRRVVVQQQQQCGLCVIINKVDRATGITIQIKFRNVCAFLSVTFIRAFFFSSFVVCSLLILFMRSTNSVSSMHTCDHRIVVVTFRVLFYCIYLLVLIFICVVCSVQQHQYHRFRRRFALHSNSYPVFDMGCCLRAFCVATTSCCAIFSESLQQNLFLWLNSCIFAP